MRLIPAALALLLLGGCGGGGPEQLAADACMAEVNQRLAGKSYEADTEKLLASATSEGQPANTLQLTTQIVFDRGLASEFTQVLKCKARIDGKAASVLSIEFIWSMEDLKKSE